ncbi:unnamed protein product [Closterium sp. NIES-53]
MTTSRESFDVPPENPPSPTVLGTGWKVLIWLEVIRLRWCCGNQQSGRNGTAGGMDDKRTIFRSLLSKKFARL